MESLLKSLSYRSSAIDHNNKAKDMTQSFAMDSKKHITHHFLHRILAHQKRMGKK